MQYEKVVNGYFFRGKIFTLSCKKGYRSLLFPTNKLKIVMLTIVISFKKVTNRHEFFVQKVMTYNFSAGKVKNLKKNLQERLMICNFFVRKSND